MQIPITGQSYTNETQDAGDQRCINLFPTKLGDHERGANPKYGPLLLTGGLAQLLDFGGQSLRGIWAVNNFVVVVRDNNIYKVTVNSLTNTATQIQIGTLTNDIGLPIRLAYNPNQFLLVNGTGNGYLYNFLTTGIAAIGPIGGSAGNTYNLNINGITIYNNLNVATALTLTALVTSINGQSLLTGVTASQMTVSVSGGPYLKLTSKNADTTITVAESGTGFVPGTNGITVTNGDFVVGTVGSMITLNSTKLGSFPGAIDVVYLDGYFVIALPNSQTMQTSDINNGHVWNPANFFTVTTSPDIIVGMAIQKQELWVMGKQRTAVFYDAGNSPGFPLAPRVGVSMTIGCSSLQSIIQFDNCIMFVDSRGYVVQTKTGDFLVNTTSGYELVAISTIPINKELSTYTIITDCLGCWYEYNGHLMAQFTFPTAHKTWVWDQSVQAWHQRTSYNRSLSADAEHLAAFSAKSGTTTLVGSYQSGLLYYQSNSVYLDNTQNIKRIRRFGPLNQEWIPITVDELIVRMESGNIPQGLAPTVKLRYSTDGAHTWSFDLPEYLGNVGEYAKIVNWNALGIGREWFIELEIDDPIPFSIIDCSARITVGE